MTKLQHAAKIIGATVEVIQGKLLPQEHAPMDSVPKPDEVVIWGMEILNPIHEVEMHCKVEELRETFQHEAVQQLHIKDELPLATIVKEAQLATLPKDSTTWKYWQAGYTIETTGECNQVEYNITNKKTDLPVGIHRLTMAAASGEERKFAVVPLIATGQLQKLVWSEWPNVQAIGVMSLCDEVEISWNSTHKVLVAPSTKWGIKFRRHAEITEIHMRTPIVAQQMLILLYVAKSERDSGNQNTLQLTAQEREKEAKHQLVQQVLDQGAHTCQNVTEQEIHTLIDALPADEMKGAMMDNTKHEQLVLKLINVMKTQEENTDQEILNAIQKNRESLDEQKVRQGFAKMSKTKRLDTAKKVITLLLQEEGFPTTNWWVQTVYQQEEVAQLVSNRQVLKKVLQQVTHMQSVWSKGELQSVLKALGDSQEANDVLEMALSSQFSNSNTLGNTPELHKRFSQLPTQARIESAEDATDMQKWWQFCQLKTVEEWPHLTTDQKKTEKEKISLFGLQQDVADMVSAKLKLLNIPNVRQATTMVLNKENSKWEVLSCTVGKQAAKELLHTLIGDGRGWNNTHLTEILTEHNECAKEIQPIVYKRLMLQWQAVVKNGENEPKMKALMERTPLPTLLAMLTQKSVKKEWEQYLSTQAQKLQVIVAGLPNSLQKQVALQVKQLLGEGELDWGNRPANAWRDNALIAIATTRPKSKADTALVLQALSHVAPERKIEVKVNMIQKAIQEFQPQVKQRLKEEGLIIDMAQEDDSKVVASISDQAVLQQMIDNKKDSHTMLGEKRDSQPAHQQNQKKQATTAMLQRTDNN